MVKRIISVMINIAMIINCACSIFMVSASAAEAAKYYLTTGYRISGSGTTDQTDSSNGSPQIKISTKQKAVAVIKTHNLSDASCVSVTYAQNGGTLGVKLTALDSADAETGTVLLDTIITDIADNYRTRTSEIMNFTAAAAESAKYMRVELAVNGSADGNSYIDYIDCAALFVMQLKSVSNSNVIDVLNSGTENGDKITGAALMGSKSQQWSLQADIEKGWYNIVNENSGKGIGLLGGTINAGEEPIQWDCDGSTNQFWRFVEVEKDGKTYYKILNKGSRRVLTINDTKITQEDWMGADNQLWEVNGLVGNIKFGSEYDDNYSVSGINASAENYVISYNVMCSLGDGMVIEIALSDGQTSREKKGGFTISADGEYILTASVYSDSEMTKKVCDDVSKTITITNGECKFEGAQWICSTELSPWTDNGEIEICNVTADEIENIKTNSENYIIVDQDTRYQTMDSHPWGGCFNEKGWYAMRDLTSEQKTEVIRTIFGPEEDSLNFTAGRTPIGSSDYGLDMYTYDETTDDYELNNFSISRDKEYLIPYIKEALKFVPDLQIFSSPWSPPSWMKTSNQLNGTEGHPPYIKDTPENFKAYAKYFAKYLEEYDAEGINIHAVTPQNESTMDTPYPSCVWSGEQLNVFLRDYLSGAIKEYNDKNQKDTKIWLGTFTDSQKSLAMPALKDPETKSMIDAVGFQWWGAPLATQVHMMDKDLKLVQSETKCGNGLNNWQYAEEQFDCFKEFLDAGVSQYHLWNMILEGDGKNNALPANRRWAQNAPISVNGTEITYRPSYYLTKHFSSNIDRGARRIKVEGNHLGEGSVKGYVQDIRAIGFQNTNGEIVLNVKNSTSTANKITIVVNNKTFDVTVPSHSVNTFKLDGAYENTPDATEVKEVTQTTNIKFTNLATNYLLSSEGYNNGDVINTTSNKGESYQTWSLIPAEKSENYVIQNFRSELVLCVWNGSIAEDAKVSQYDNTDSDDQKWAVEFVEYRGDTAYYKIVNYNSKLVLTALGENEDTNLNYAVTQRKYTGTDNQLWSLNIVGGDWTFPDKPTETSKPVVPEMPQTDTKITLSNDKYILSTVLNNVAEDNVIIIAAYDEKGRCLSVKTEVSSGETVTNEFDLDSDISHFKIMAWNSLSEMNPLTLSETKQVPKAEDYSAYLFAYFRRPPGQRDDERLCLGVSRDGYTFRQLNNGEPVFAASKTHTPGLQYEAFRDPQVMRGQDGKFYITVTDLLGTGNKNHQITIYPTADLIDFEQGIVVDYSQYEGFENTIRAWAPQIIWCPEHDNNNGTAGAYMIYLALQPGEDKELQMYHQFTTDLYDISKYTVPQVMLEGEDESSIDGDIIYNPNSNQYVMYYNGQRISVCDTIDGIYRKQDRTVFGDTRAVEGSNMFKLNNEDKWIYCADGGSFGTGFNMAETIDFETYTELKATAGGFDYDFTPRHGYVVAITESELDALMGQYGYVDLPDRNNQRNPLKDMTLPYTAQGYKIAGNITLPCEYNGHSITWTSSNENIISTQRTKFTSEQKKEYGENYTEIPPGVVTRPAEDTAVSLIASVDGTDYTKKFTVKVKAMPEKNYKQMDADGDFKGYLYASFIEPAVSKRYQQVYFASSDDGRNWKELNNNKPVLESELGTGATRDHYILRSPEGDRFYLIATDLDVTDGDWGAYSGRGSKYLMIWESDDLVNWSEQRMVKVADLSSDTNTGCAWAPEATYDEITGEYIVYWSGKELNEDSPYYGKMVVWYSKTRDFYSFTPQKQFVYAADTDSISGTNTTRCFIDTTMIQGSDGLFYRTTKFEESSPLHVFVDVAKYPLGEFKRLKTNLDETDFLGTEGPGWFKYNKDDAEIFGTKYCLMLDGYGNPNKGVGFFPNSVEDLNQSWESIEDGTAELLFTRIKDNYHMRSYAKHGGILPLTQEEYDRVNEAYADKEPVYSDSKPIPVNSYDFEQENLAAIQASFTSGASLVKDVERDSKVLYLDGSTGSYMELSAPKDNDGNVLERYTVSFDIKNKTTGNYFNFYIGDGSSGKTGINYLGVKIGNDILLSSKNSSSELKQNYTVSDVQGKWKHCDIVVADGTVYTYIDNMLIGSFEGFTMAESAARVIRFGFSPWNNDNATNAYYDNVKVYPEALSADGLNQEDIPEYFADENLCFNSDDYWIAVDDNSALSNKAGWTSEQMPKFDGNPIHYIGIYPGKPVTMGGGYGKNKDWVAMQFNLTNWAHGDYAVSDIDGNVIFADCYAADGYWVGHGERSFGGSVKDGYGIKRLPNYLKTVVTAESEIENTGKIAYGKDTLCTILIENRSGQVDSYTGGYYTVKNFKNMKLVSTEYHKGHINGIKMIENYSGNSDRNCFGDLKIYSEMNNAH